MQQPQQDPLRQLDALRDFARRHGLVVQRQNKDTAIDKDRFVVFRLVDQGANSRARAIRIAARTGLAAVDRYVHKAAEAQ